MLQQAFLSTLKNSLLCSPFVANVFPSPKPRRFGLFSLLVNVNFLCNFAPSISTIINSLHHLFYFNSTMNIHVVRRSTTALLVIVACAALVMFATAKPSKEIPNMTPSAKSIYEFTLNDIDGKNVKLEQFKGKVVLIVNVASKCGYTPQYEGLEKIYKQYKDKGFVILGFPANNFMGQEPGSEADIKQFCTTKYNVTFPMFSKISVKGSDMHPLYQYLTQSAAPAGDVKWNFSKFLIGKDGSILARFDSGVKPESAELTSAVESALK